MKLFNVQANIVALSGIVIAIGTIVDMGIVICENILKHLDQADPAESRLEVVHRAASEVGGAVLTAVLTTIIGFLPVFTMIGAEGKLFKPLAFTKSFALIASILLALTVLPVLAHAVFGRARSPSAPPRTTGRAVAALKKYLPILLTVLLVGIWLTLAWEPLGPEKGIILNLLFVALLIGGLLAGLLVFQHFYARILGWCLKHKILFLSIPAALLLLGFGAWRQLGKEFMPDLDEGSFLWMPTTMTHASIGEALDIL
jgi:Cu(I)/Ag(I) efflux system membrane protein CusA/SilA